MLAKICTLNFLTDGILCPHPFTGYSKPAKKYAKSAKVLTGGKSIDLYEFRPSTELDEKGFIKTIIIKLHVIKPNPHYGKWLPHFTESGNAALKALLNEGED